MRKSIFIGSVINLKKIASTEPHAPLLSEEIGFGPTVANWVVLMDIAHLNPRNTTIYLYIYIYIYIFPQKTMEATQYWQT